MLRNSSGQAFYDKGDLADIFGQFYDNTGAVVAPSVVIFHLLTPAGVASTPAVTSGTAPDALTAAYEAAGISTGIVAGAYYRYRLDITETGTYTGKWNSTGTGQAGTPDFAIVVRGTAF